MAEKKIHRAAKIKVPYDTQMLLSKSIIRHESTFVDALPANSMWFFIFEDTLSRVWNLHVSFIVVTLHIKIIPNGSTVKMKIVSVIWVDKIRIVPYTTLPRTIFNVCRKCLCPDTVL